MRFKKPWIEYIIAAALALLVTAIIFRPYIFDNRVPFSANLLPSFYEPWLSYPRPEYPNGPANKPTGFDAVRIFYPLRNLSTELLKRGSLPLWNPYNFAGNTLLATYQSAIFHPLTWLFFLLPQIDAWSLIVFSAPILSFLFMYAFLRQIKLSALAAGTGALVFAFSGFSVVWWEESIMASYTMLFLPLILLGIEKVFTKQTRMSFVILTAALTLSITSGWFQFTLYAWIFSAFWIAYRLWQKKPGVRAVLFLGASYLCAVLLSAIHLVPGLEAMQLSARSSTDAKYLFDLYLLPLSRLITLLVPDFFGNPGSYNYFGGGFYYERMLYIGVAPIFFVLYQLLNWNKHTKEERFFSISFLIALSLGVAIPTSWFLLYTLKLPILSVIIPSRIFYLSTFAGAALAACTADRFLVGLEKKKLLIASVFLLLGLGTAIGLVLYARHIVTQPVPKSVIDMYKLFTEVSFRNLILPTAFVSATILAIWTGELFKKIRLVALIAVILVTAGGAVFFAQKYIYFSDRNLVYYDTPVVQKLQEISGVDRFWTSEHGYIQSNFATMFRLYSPEGYDSFYIRRYGELLAAASHKGQYLQEIPRADATIASTDTFTDILADPYRSRMLQILGVKYVARKNIKERSGPVDVHADPKLNLVWTDDVYQIFRYTDAMPRVFLTNQYTVDSDPQKILDALFDPKTDVSKTIILEESPVGLPLQGNSVQNTATVSSYTANTITIQTEASSSALLFLSDNYYPGWVARVDGKLTKVYRADYAFRAVTVPAGTHTVKFSFEPVSVKLGAVLTAIGVALILGVLLLIKPRQRS